MGHVSAPADTHSYHVQGMTCQHCVSAVSEEVGQVPGVTGVEVDLDSGGLLVHGGGFEDGAIRAAVEEAGYTLAEPV